jgi:ferrous iron transport protein A
VAILLSDLKIGETAIILDVNIEEIPLKLLEMGCLPGNIAKLIQIAPLGDPFYFNINDSHVAIRKETAVEITVVLENQI